MFGFRPLYDRRSLVISLEDMESIEFGSMKKASEAIGVREENIMYAKKNEKNFLEDTNAKVFFIKWC